MRRFGHLLIFLLVLGGSVDCGLYADGLTGGFCWLYFLPTVSDADLQYGTALTLTGPPLVLEDNQNLSAHIVTTEPGYTSGYRFNVGYELPCSWLNVDLDYFNFRASDSDSVTSPVRNALTYQFLQNFLGGGYVSGSARDTQRIDQVDLCVGSDFMVDNCLRVRPYLGLSFAYVKRNLDVVFTDFVVPPLVDPIPASLVGGLSSRYWGVGPAIGSSFSLPIFPCIEFGGHFGLSLLGGNVSAKIDSNSVREALVQSFSAGESSSRFAPVVRSDLQLTCRYPICRNKLAIALSVGYEVDYFFRVVDRVDPIDGYVNNPGSTPMTTPSSIGLGGPYAQIALTTACLPCCKLRSCGDDCGLYFTIENGWLKPHATGGDLTYGTLNLADGSSKDLATHPHYSWSGSYCLGYRSGCNVDIEARYRTFQNRGSSATVAGPFEGISSLNASGPEGVAFGAATSRVNYNLHQFDLGVGKSARLCNLWWSPSVRPIGDQIKQWSRVLKRCLPDSNQAILTKAYQATAIQGVRPPTRGYSPG